MGKLQDIIASIDKRHQEQIGRKAESGQLRSLELLWKTHVKERHNIDVPDFVGRDREHLRHLWREVGPKLSELLTKSIQYWVIMRQEKYLDRLSPTPIFRELFTFRAQILAYLAAKEQREKVSTRALDNLKKYEKEAKEQEGKKIDFTAMVEEAKKKLREGKK